MIDKTVFGEPFSYRFEDRDSAIQVFNDHVEEVRVIPEEKLLMHSAKMDGNHSVHFRCASSKRALSVDE